jgi:glutaminyl-peptide cyclotransferase
VAALATAGVVAALVLADGGRAPAATTVPEALRAKVVETHPHATDAFTQGLLWHEGVLYESTGLHGRSSLRAVELETGEVQRRRTLPRKLFAEGLARVDDRLVQLTWNTGKALVWKMDPFERVGSHEYEGEGWGLCYDGEHLVMSDGSAQLTFRDAETFEPQRRIRVTRIGRPVRHLNELECVRGSVWANVWRTEDIIRIDPESGKVTAVVDASGLLTDEEARKAEVLNGIAWLPDRERFALTGKLWPKLFEVEMVPRKED